MGIPKGRRRLFVVLAVLVVAGLAAAVVHRVLAPAEVVTEARAGLPPAVDRAPGTVGRLVTAPLVVDRRLRIYATTRQVWADAPVDARARRTPYWSYRRWPAQVSGVAAVGTTVVTRWSDGRLVALDAKTGRVAWRTDGPAPAEGWTGRRTGAEPVWTPVGLHTATAVDGRPVVVTVGDGHAQGTELTTGRRLWRVAVECRTPVGTTAAGRLATLDRCADVPVVEFRDVATGAVTDRWQPPGVGPEATVTPLGCAPARSACTGLRIGGPDDAGRPDPGPGEVDLGRAGPGTAEIDAGGRGWLLGPGPPVAAPGLDGAGTGLVDEVTVRVVDGVATGRAARTGAELWRRAGLGVDTRLIATQPGRAHLLTADRELITLDPATGAERSRFRMTVGRDGIRWAPGRVMAADGFVALERLRQPVDPDAADQRYYQAAEPVILART